MPPDGFCYPFGMDLVSVDFNSQGVHFPFSEHHHPEFVDFGKLPQRFFYGGRKDVNATYDHHFIAASDDTTLQQDETTAGCFRDHEITSAIANDGPAGTPEVGQHQFGGA